MANLTTAQATRQAVSAQWALNQLGAQNYYNLCERFIENAYGTSSRYASAAAASNALMTNPDMGEADVGDLVFFRPDPSNGNYGHVGIYLGNGEMVSATNSGITRDNITSGYWKNLLVGFGDPPDQWQGRSEDQSLLQGAADLVAKGSANAGDPLRALKAKAVSTWGGAGQFIQQIAAAAQKYDIPVNLLAAKVNVESGGNPNATSPAGAKGLLQLMPGTARSLGVTDINDVDQNLDAGAKYFRQMYDQTGDWDDALRAYNAGPNGNWNNAETINHVKKVNQWADQIGEEMAGYGAGGAAGSGFSGPGGAGGRLPGETAADERARRRAQQQQSQFADFWAKIEGLGDAGLAAAEQGIGGIGNFLGGIGSARDRFLRQRGSLGPIPGALGAAGAAAGGAAGSAAAAAAAQQEAIRQQNEARNRQVGQVSALDQIRGLFGGGSPGAGAPGAPGGTPGIGPGAPGMPGVPGGGGFIPPNSSSDPAGGTVGGGTNYTGALGPTTAPGGGAAPERKRPAGYIDPSQIRNPAYMGIIGQWNSALEAAQMAQDRVNSAASEEDRILAQKGLDKANELVRGLAPTTANIIQAAEKEEGGQFAPGTSAKQKQFTIVRRNPDTGKWETQVIDNPAWEEDASIQSTRLSNQGALERQNAADRAALARTQAELASRQGISQAEIASREKISGQEIASREGIANLNASTTRATTALNAAISQRSQDIEAAIRKGDLSLREGTEQFNQWYKQNVEAPLAILQQQRETERYKVERENAVTQRATAKAEHERGIANIGQQMWGQAASAYNQMIPLTVGAGWGEGFQKNLAAGAGGYTPNQGATYNVPESLDQFATRKVAEMLKGVSPYADSILASGGQSQGIGSEYERSGPISAQGMDQLRNTAVGTAQNALNNPFQMPWMQPIPDQPQVDIAGLAGAGMPGFTDELDKYIPQYGSNGNGGGDGMIYDNVDWTKLFG